MSIGNTNTKVYLYNNDYNALCTEIYHHQHIETGGDLFGLWTTTGDAVVHVALGPGKKCKRTTVSFHQDIAYLSRVGTFLNQKFMLCHIGEWHSHHHLSLNEPSSGDKRTVRENYPNGIKKFLVIIGNIVGPDRVVLSPYYFSAGGKTCEKGILHVLVDTVSPFTTDLTIAEEMNKGAENPSRDLICSSSPNDGQQQTAPPDRPDANGHLPQSTKDVTSNLAIYVTPGAGLQNSAHPSPSSGSYAKAVTSGSSASPDKNPSEMEIPTPDYEQNHPLQTTSSSSNHPSAHDNPSISNPSSASQAKSDESNNQTRQEVILKKVFDEIKSKFDDSDIAIERSRDSGVIEIKFKHNNKYWLLKFPESFPQKPAEIYQSLSEKFVGASNCARSNPEILNNHIDILLTIKSQSCCSSYCACQKLDVQSITKASTLDLFLTEKGHAMIIELCDKVKDTLADAGSLKEEIKYDSVSGTKRAFLEVCFKHCSKIWGVIVSSTFPSCPAKVYWRGEYRNRYSAMNCFTCESGQHSSSKDWATTVLSAIAKSCDCTKCKRSYSSVKNV